VLDEVNLLFSMCFDLEADMNVIDTKNLAFGYSSKKILHDVSISIPQGNVVALIGPNGSGKSTLLRCLAGILAVPKKTVYINGLPVEKYNTNRLARQIAFLPQFQENPGSVSVYDLIAMGRASYHRSGWISNQEDREKIKWAMEYMNLTDYACSAVNALSGGVRQRVWIAMTLAQDSPVILLDEPVTYMDIKHQQELLAVISDLRRTCNKTVITVFHDINHAMEVSDLVCVMRDGRIYDFGQPEEIVTEQMISEVFEVQAHVCHFHQCRRKVVVPGSCRMRKGNQRRRNRQAEVDLSNKSFERCI
jgi:iron complex transport system ATP-binding protein